MTHSPTQADEELRAKLASLMHDAGKCYLMIERDERHENNFRLADEAMKLILQREAALISKIEKDVIGDDEDFIKQKKYLTRAEAKKVSRNLLRAEQRAKLNSYLSKKEKI